MNDLHHIPFAALASCKGHPARVSSAPQQEDSELFDLQEHKP
jgi:hypothetical protein